MTREDLSRMLTLVDEKYIDELTKDTPVCAPAAELKPPAEETPITVQTVDKRMSLRPLAAIAAAFALCIPLGFGVFHTIRQSSIEPGSQLPSVESISGINPAAMALTDAEIEQHFTGLDVMIDVTLAAPGAEQYAEHLSSVPAGDAWFDDASARIYCERDGYAQNAWLEIKGEHADASLEIWKDTQGWPFGLVYHIEKYDADISAMYSDDGTECYFSNGENKYMLCTSGMSKRDVIALVYEILESGCSAADTAELAHLPRIEKPITSYSAANNLGFCSGCVPAVGLVEALDQTAMPEHIIWHDPDTDEITREQLLITMPHKEDAEQFLNFTYDTDIEQDPEVPVIELDYTFDPLSDDDLTAVRDIHFYVRFDTCMLEVEGYTEVHYVKSYLQALEDQYYTERDLTLAEANVHRISKDWVPQKDAYGSLTLDRCCYQPIPSEESSSTYEHVFLRYADQYDNSLEIRYYPSGAAAEGVYSAPQIEAADDYYISMKTVSSAPCCKVIDTSYIDDLDGYVITKADYNFWIKLPQCEMVISASCSGDDIDAFINTLHQVGKINTGSSLPTYITLGELNEMEFCYAQVPQITTVGRMHFLEGQQHVQRSEMIPDGQPRWSAALYYGDDDGEKVYTGARPHLTVFLTEAPPEEMYMEDGTINAADLDAETVLHDFCVKNTEGYFDAYFCIDTGSLRIRLNISNCTADEVTAYVNELRCTLFGVYE